MPVWKRLEQCGFVILRRAFCVISTVAAFTRLSTQASGSNGPTMVSAGVNSDRRSVARDLAS